MADNLVIFGHTYNNVAGFKATDTNNTEQTFLKTVLGTKSISANGTYNASSDGLDGFSQVNVSVPNTYTAGDEGKVVSNGALVAQGSDTVTENGTVDTTLISSLLVDVPSGGGDGYKKYKSGTVTPSADWNTLTNHQITTVSNIGFTPKAFILTVTSESSISGVQYAVIATSFFAIGSPEHYVRWTTRYTNTSGTLGNAGVATSWTTQANQHLYLNNGNIYFRTTAQYILKSGVSYTWYAYE